MTGSKNSDELDKKSEGSGDDSEEDESEILEESPCGRWSKRRQEVQQRDVPGIEAAYLAMDTEEGMEVVWNEVRISERHNVKDQERKIEEVFENLTQLDHPNIVKLHKYWTDTKQDSRRVVFITEYMSSGSLKKFLKLTKRNVKKLPLQSWKRWCSQILSALSYLHSCSPPFIHGNLTTESIFIQHNGLVKIGSVAPDAIETHVKTCHGDIKNTHFIAPEYGNTNAVTPAADIYSFGMAALEMAALEIPGNGDSGIKITPELIKKTIDSLENNLQKDFIQQCLDLDPVKRSVSSKLLFHPALFDVHSLKLIAAHSVVHGSKQKYMDGELEKLTQRVSQSDFVVAEIKDKVTIKRSDIADADKLANFIEEVRLDYPKYSIYPLTTDKLPPPVLRRRPLSPEVEAKSSVAKADETAAETRKIVNMMCTIRGLDVGKGFSMTLSLRMEDKMNRQLTCGIEAKDGPGALADELVHHGFINEIDREKVAATIHAEMARVRFGIPVVEMNGDLHAMNFGSALPTTVPSTSR